MLAIKCQHQFTILKNWSKLGENGQGAQLEEQTQNEIEQQLKMYSFNKYLSDRGFHFEESWIIIGARSADRRNMASYQNCRKLRWYWYFAMKLLQHCLGRFGALLIRVIQSCCMKLFLLMMAVNQMKLWIFSHIFRDTHPYFIHTAGTLFAWQKFGWMRIQAAVLHLQSWFEGPDWIQNGRCPGPNGHQKAVEVPSLHLVLEERHSS